MKVRMTKLKWNKYMMFAAAIIVVVLPTNIFAAEFTDNIMASKDGAVIVAVHPYMADREKFRMPKNMRFMVPVGVMIQNRSEETIGIEEMMLVDSRDHGVWINRISPYMERPFGAIVENRGMMNDAGLMQAELCSSGGCKKTGRLRVNEIFHAPWIEPGESYYGIIYLEARKGRTTPERIWSVDDLVLTIPVVRKDFTRAYMLNVSLSGDKEKEELADKSFMESGKRGNDPFEQVYIGRPGNRPDNKVLYKITKALSECAERSIGEAKGAKSRPYGSYASIDIRLDRRGEYLEHTLNKSGIGWLDKLEEEVAKDIKSCEVPPVVGGGVAGEGEEHYKYEIVMGDVVAYEMDKADDYSKEKK